MRRTEVGCLDDRKKKGLSGDAFDYGSVSPRVAKFLVGQADRIRHHCVTSAINIGGSLLEAKRHLSHGEFLRWVECEVGIPARTAQAYMRVANWVSGKSAAVARLSPTILYLLSSTGTPEHFVEGVLQRVERGERVLPSTLRKELKCLRSSKQGGQSRTQASAAENPSDLEWRNRAAVSKRSNAVTEFVDILVHGLPAFDFARVREIMTSEALLSAPDLVENLEREVRKVRMRQEAPRLRGGARAGIADRAESQREDRANYSGAVPASAVALLSFGKDQELAG